MTIYVKKALAVNAYDVIVNTISVGRRPQQWEAVEEAKRLAKLSGMEYIGVKRTPKAKTEKSLFVSKHKAFPKGWKWGDK